MSIPASTNRCLHKMDLVYMYTNVSFGCFRCGHSQMAKLGPCLFCHFHNYLLAFDFPLEAVALCIIQVLVTGDAKDAAILEFSGERNDVKVEKANLARIPVLAWIDSRSAQLVGLVHLQEQTLVPLAIHVPVLHCMDNVGSLNEMFNDNGCLAGRQLVSGLGSDCGLGKGHVPALLTLNAQFLVHDISGKHRVDEQLAEAHEFFLGLVDDAPESRERVLHEQVPGDIHRILLGDALVLVKGGTTGLFFDELRVWDAAMVDVMDQCLPKEATVRLATEMVNNQL